MIDLSHIADSSAGLLAVALAAIVVARILFRMAFKVLLVFAVIGAGAIGVNTVRLPAGLDQAVSGNLQEVVQQAKEMIMFQVERLFPNQKIRVVAPGLQSKLFEPDDIGGAMHEAERLAALFNLEIHVSI